MSHRIEIAGISFDSVTYDQVFDRIELFINHSPNQHIVVTPNPEMIVESKRNETLKKVLNDASLSVPDGIGILWASYYLSLPLQKEGWKKIWQVLWSLTKVLFKSKDIYSILPERVTGSDLLFKIVEKSQKHQWRIYLLGAQPGVGQVAIERLLQEYPNAIFAGSFAGTPVETHEDELCQMISQSEADILFVAYGSPNQELWIHRNLHKISKVKVAIGVGGAIDFAAGIAKRAPGFMRKWGLEWFWRLIRQPSRIKRIWNATFVFTRMIYQIKNHK